MKIDVLEKKENPLFERDEIKLSLEFDSSTPKREEMREEIAKTLALNKELFVIRETQPKPGMKKLIVLIHVYKNKEKMFEIEPQHILKRNGLLVEEKKEG